MCGSTGRLVPAALAFFLLAATPAASQYLYIEPASFHVSPGERTGVTFRAVGLPRLQAAWLRNATLLTDFAAFNVTGLHEDGERVAGFASVRSTGTLVVYASISREDCIWSAKALIVSAEPGAGFRRLAGLPLEIVPERDPYTLKAGEMLPVVVRLHGRPAPNVSLNAVSTDADGRASVLVTGGKQTLEAKAGCLSSTLTFELP
jgi:hypothetical protein